MRVEIKKIHQRLNTTVVYVTHDQIEAMTLADLIVVREGPKHEAGHDTRPRVAYNRRCSNRRAQGADNTVIQSCLTD